MRIYDLFKEKFKVDLKSNELDNTETIVLNKRQITVLVNCIILICLSIFVIGFFWGQRRAIVEFNNKLINDSFADQVNYSMYSLYNENTIDEEPKALAQDAANEVKTEPIVTNNQEKLKFHAQLIGFGSIKNAQQFVNKLQKKGYNLVIVPRKSKTAKGKVVTWYQVITQKFDNKKTLEELINKIQQIVKLNQIEYISTDN